MFYPFLPLLHVGRINLPKPYQKGRLSIFVLIRTKALSKRGVFLYYCSNPNQSPATKGVFLYFSPYSNNKECFTVFIFALILTETLPKKVFSLLLPYSSQSPTLKGVSLYFWPYSNQSTTKKGVFSIFALILTKALPKRRFSLFLLLYYPKLHQKSGVFFYLF